MNVNNNLIIVMLLLLVPMLFVLPLLVLDNQLLPVLALEDTEEMVLLVLISMNVKKVPIDVIVQLLVPILLDHMFVLVEIIGLEMVILVPHYVTTLNGLNVKDFVMVLERNIEELILLL
jgi:hypothetical protein